MSGPPWLSSTLLGRLGEVARRELLRLGVRRSAGTSQVILREGTREDHVIVLVDALAKVTVAMTNGRQALLDVRVSGDIVGEISALNGTPRSATVTTCRPATIQIVRSGDFRAFLRTYPDAALEVAGIVADRLRWANRRRIDFASYPVKVRLARALWEIAIAYGHREDQGIVVDIQLTQAELATLCGAAEITVQKVLRDLRDLRESGVLVTGYRHIVVRDVDALRESADVG
jgi:CRP/FNR family transcriptional regulator, cyclic AMP receptor protein